MYSMYSIVVDWMIQFTVLNQINGSGLQRLETTLIVVSILSMYSISGQCIVYIIVHVYYV